MFYSLTGNIIMTDASSVAIECGGVGFRCSASLNTLKKIGSAGNKVTLFTHLAVREDALELFGFYDENELNCFKLLISVSGVGPKAALSVLSELTPEKLALAVANGDVKAVTKAQGVGPKIAQRLILELKSKLTVASSDSDDDFMSTDVQADSEKTTEAVSALQFLGFSQYEAAKAVRGLDPALSVEDMIKKALALLSKNI